MKLTENSKEFVKEYTHRIAQQIGITQNENPDAVLTRKEYINKTLKYKGIKRTRRTVTHKYLGVSHRNDGFIFINVKRHSSLEQLKDTIIHELVHYRFDYLRHGKNFDKRIQLIKMGKVYKLELKTKLKTVTHREFSFCTDCFGEPCYCNRIKGYNADTGTPIVYVSCNESTHLESKIRNFCFTISNNDTMSTKS